MPTIFVDLARRLERQARKIGHLSFLKLQE
jgi:hypothetical protein